MTKYAFIDETELGPIPVPARWDSDDEILTTTCREDAEATARVTGWRIIVTRESIRE